VDIYKKEGIKALWKGLGPNLIGVVPARSIYFSVYTQGKHIYTNLNNGIESSFIHLCSAGTAGVITALFTNPIWLIKTRMVIIN
jgi:solute carrier family 25 protein 33/36